MKTAETSSSSEAVGRPALTDRQRKNAERLYAMEFGKLYPAWLAKAEGKGRNRAELDEALCWLTGHSPKSLAAAIASGESVEQFIAHAPQLNPARALITGKVCGVQVEEVEDPRMRLLRQADKLVDELAKGWAMERVLRG